MVVGVKKSVVLGLVAGFLGLGFLHGGIFAQQKSSFKVGGPCMACGASYVEALAKGIDGVSSATLDPSKSMLTVDFNPVSASLVDIQLELSVHGYDAGDFTRDTKAKLPACANAGGMRGDQAADGDIPEPGIDDIEGLEADDDWENPEVFDVAGNNIVDDDVDLLEEEDDDSDLGDWIDDKEDNDKSVIVDDEEEDDDEDDL